MIVIGPISEPGRDVSSLVKDAHAAIDHNDLEFAGNLLVEHLYNEPDDVYGWIALTRFFMDASKAPFAYPVALQAVQKERNWHTLTMLGAVEANLQKPTAHKTLKQALKLIPDGEGDKDRALVYRLLANAYSQAFNWHQAEKWAGKSLEIEDHHQAHTALAFAKLHQREWKEGWYHYQFQLGHHDYRIKHDYGLPEWEGQEGRVLVYGDQGLGDQIAFMGAMPIKPAQINCVGKLQKLFQRNFPFSEVYGDMYKKNFDWELKSDYQVSMATAMQWADIKPRGAYLKPMREKVIQWEGLLNSNGSKPKIGIAWTGGKTGSAGWRDRSLTLNDLRPLLEMDVDWVSLEYKDKSDEIGLFEHKTGIKVLDYPWGTQSEDYDDTAALVSCLDAVVCVPTTIYHLCGALGKPALVLVHDQPHFHEGVTGPSPYWESVEFYRRAEIGTEEAIKAVQKRLKDLIRTFDSKEVA